MLSVCLPVCLCDLILTATCILTADFHETLCDLCATGGELGAAFYNVLQSVMIAWRTSELVRWEQK
jgi:hypothetical protein